MSMDPEYRYPSISLCLLHRYIEASPQMTWGISGMGNEELVSFGVRDQQQQETAYQASHIVTSTLVRPDY